MKATAIEYGLIAALICVAAITAMQSVGAKAGKPLNTVERALDASELDHIHTCN